MVLLRADGRVWQTAPENDHGKYRDIEIGPISGFDYTKPTFVDLEVAIDGTELRFDVGGVVDQVPIQTMPYVYGAGKVRVVTSMCRVRIQEIELQQL